MCQRLMLRCGLRVRKGNNVRWEVIAMTQGTLRVHHRKGPVDRMVSLSPDGATALRQWHGLRSASIGNQTALEFPICWIG
jgi:integrase